MVYKVYQNYNFARYMSKIYRICSISEFKRVIKFYRLHRP